MAIDQYLGAQGAYTRARPPRFSTYRSTHMACSLPAVPCMSRSHELGSAHVISMSGRSLLSRSRGGVPSEC
jgi:hypothetical protein